jgi:hypothetical protein
MTPRRRLPHRRLLALAASWTLVATIASTRFAAPAPQAHPADDRTSAGQRIYLHGTSASGAPFDAIVQGDLRVAGTTVPCVNCHRRSGWGTAEGPVNVPPVVASALFQPVTQGAPQIHTRTTGAGTRPAYSAESLLRLLREGIDPAGRTVSPTMPRYDISDSDGAALVAYLRRLGQVPPAGVTESSVHLATIVTAGVAIETRESLLEVLRTYVQRINAETRYEARRRERGPWDMQHYENYRDWVLHVWTLANPPDTWPSQLEELYREEPVFAIVGGISDTDWTPIHEFSGRHGIPVVLPQAVLSPVDGSPNGFYSFYFSGGVAVEARALAQYLAGGERALPPLQISRCDNTGRAAATAFIAASKERVPRTECIAEGTDLSGLDWRGLLRGVSSTLVLWLDSRDLAALASVVRQPAFDQVDEIYLSSTLLGRDVKRVPPELAARGVLLHPSVAPDDFERHAWRLLAWIKANGLAPADKRVAVNALFAATLVGDALNVPRTLDSREYFVERIEHMAGRSPSRSEYPSVSFDPRRRIASLGCSLLKMPAAPGGGFRKVAPWFVPQ